MYRDEAADPPAIMCIVGKTVLSYQLRAVEDLHAMLKKHGDWMPLDSTDEQKPAAEGTVEAWAAHLTTRSAVVWLEEGPTRALRHVAATAARSTGYG